MFDNLFGTDMPLPIKFIVAFVIVLALIALATWAFRRVGATRLGAPSARGRQPRLAVLDAASVDGRRRLVLIRRDNVEHLLLIGGPSDVVIEQNIVRAVPVGPPREAPLRAHEAMPRGPEAAPRSEPRQPEAAWIPEPAQRGPRQAEPTFAPPPEPVGRQPRQPEPPPRMQPPVELTPRPLPEPVTAALRGATPPTASPPGAAPPSAPEPGRAPARPAAARQPESEQPVEMRQSPPTADVNLADMAQRLEAALRRPARSAEPAPLRPRPAGEGPRPPAPPTNETARTPRPAPMREAPREMPSEKPSETPLEAAPEAPHATAPEAAPEPPPVATPEPAKPSEATAEPKPAPAKSVFDSLEEEMANLLGRPPAKK